MKHRVLSTHRWDHMPFWAALVDTYPLAESERKPNESTLGFALREIGRGVRLWWRSRSYDAVITDSSPHAAVFGALLRLPFTRKPRHMVLECLWSWPSGRFPLEGIVKSLQFRATVTPYSRAVHYARSEREAFGACFRIPAERFVFIPYHTTLVGYQQGTSAPPRQGRYIFAGGDGQRDYASLFEAVKGLPIPVVVAILDPATIAGLAVPPNVEVVSVDGVMFRRLMEHAWINVVPLRSDALRSGGHQTFLNAMAFGSVTVASDALRSADYIENWTTGVLAETGDARGLRDILERLLEDDDLVARIAANGRATADWYSTERILGLYVEFLLSDKFYDRDVSEYLGTPASPLARLPRVSGPSRVRRTTVGA